LCFLESFKNQLFTGEERRIPFFFDDFKNERDPPLFTGKLLIKFQNILRNTTQIIIRHRVKILFSVIIKSNNSGMAKVKITVILVTKCTDPLVHYRQQSTGKVCFVAF
jgi:hypothetical protein